MKLREIMPILTVVMVVLVGTAFVGGDGPVADDELGLAKNDVLDTPDPVVATPVGGEPGENATIAPYAEGAPPLVPHEVAEFLPITLDENACVECHVDAEMIGQDAAEGDPTPAPASHFTDLRRDPEHVTTELIGARYFCNQCHVAQTDAAPLVDNTFH